MIQAVVFDMDGVIFDSETLLTQCWVDVTKKDGIPDVEHTNYLCLGVNDAETKEIFLDVYGQDFPYDAYEKEVIRLFRERASGGKLPKKAGVEELLSFLKEQGIMIALATSSREAIVHDEIDHILPVAGQKEVFLLLQKNRSRKDVMFFDCSETECFGKEQLHTIEIAWKERKTIPGFCSRVEQPDRSFFV